MRNVCIPCKDRQSGVREVAPLQTPPSTPSIPNTVALLDNSVSERFSMTTEGCNREPSYSPDHCSGDFGTLYGRQSKVGRQEEVDQLIVV